MFPHIILACINYHTFRSVRCKNKNLMQTNHCHSKVGQVDNPEVIRVHLGLKNVLTNIAGVYVPENSKLLVGRIGEQPNFGLTTRSGFQYQLLD